MSQYPFQRRVASAIQFLRETGKKVIEVRKSAMKRGEQVPDDILQRIIQQEGLLASSDITVFITSTKECA